MNSGYIRLYRKTLDNPIVMKTTEHFAIFIYLILNATHTERKILFNGEEIILQKGQLITGRNVISEKLQINQSKVQRVLDYFEKNQIIEQQKTTKGRLITITNWNIYQTNEQQVNNERTTSEQQVNTNNNDNNVNNNITTTNIYDFIEQNFGRTLSPIEYEEISHWEDTELTRYAIKQSVLNGKFSIKYISKIIYSYEKENIRTVQEAQSRENDFQKKQTVSKEKTYTTSHDRWEEVKKKFLEGEE